jgi:hypothetical protein
LAGVSLIGKIDASFHGRKKNTIFLNFANLKESGTNVGG